MVYKLMVVKVFAACDSKYFNEHGRAYIASAKSVGYDPTVLILNPTEDLIGLPNTEVRYSTRNDKTYYACSRFLWGCQFLPEEGMFITDIDCFFLKKVPPVLESIGLFLREYERFQRMKVAAGLVWLSGDKRSQEFLEAVSKNILKRDQYWYTDQLALYEEYKNVDYPVHCFRKRHMDWDFNEDSFMWTGKGNRKYKNLQYLARKQEIENGLL